MEKKLFMLRLEEGGSICKHVKEIFDELAVIGDAISEEDRVVHLSSPITCCITSLEAQESVPKWDVVKE